MEHTNIDIAVYQKVIKGEGTKEKPQPDQLLELMVDDQEKSATLILNKRPVIKLPAEKLIIALKALVEFSVEAMIDYNKEHDGNKTVSK